MSFSSVAVIVLIACYRRSDVKARPQDEENVFVQKPTFVYKSGGHFDEDNSYVDSTHQEYHPQSTPVTPTASAAAAAATAKSLKIARDNAAHSSGLSQKAASASAVSGGKTLTYARSDAVAAAGLNRLGNLDSAASSFNGFASGANPALTLPPAPPPPLSPLFSFPTGGPGIGQFGSSSFGGEIGPGSISFGGGRGGGGGGGLDSKTNGGSSEAGYNDVQPVIHKSVYVHVAPQEDQVPKQKVILPKIAPKKNYQIVFIKAPTPAPPSAPVIPPFPPQSDKTLIYVLHPKPEEAPPIHIPAPPQNAPVKPEVYFIRYKSKKEQEEDDVNGGGIDIDDDGGGGGGGGGGGYHHRRYGRDGLDEEAEEESESLDVTDSASGARSSAAPLPSSTNVDVNEDGPAASARSQSRYDRGDQSSNDNDNSGESSNIIRIYTTERGGKNAH